MTNPIIDKYSNIRYCNEHGQLHRLDGPALIHPNGDTFWYFNGKHHRTDGPAIIYSDGYQAYLVNGKLHRLDGPAIIRAGGTQYWYIHDNQLTEDQFNDITQSEEHLNWYLLKIL